MQERHLSDTAFRGRMRNFTPPGTTPAARPMRPSLHVQTAAKPLQPQHAATTRSIDGIAVKPQFVPPPQPTSQQSLPHRPQFSHTVPAPAPHLPGVVTHANPRVRHKPAPAHAVAQPRQNRSVVLQRHAVKKSAHAIHKATRRRRFSPMFVVVLSASLFVLGVGAAGYALWTVNHAAGQVAGAKTEDKDAAKKNPFESPPSVEDYRSHTAQADLPRYVRIPGLRINARAKQVSYEPSTGLETPVNIYDMGWYGQSGRPNDVKTMVFSVRTRGKTNDSPYTGLDKLKPGNFIEVEQGDGNKLFYKVVSSSPVEPGKFALSVASMAADSKKQGLSIVSYSPTGPDATAYEPTLIVYAIRM